MTASNTYGRGVWLPLTNKSGGGVIAGDVVVVDTTNNDAFTTDTSGGFTDGVGVAQGTIANNAVGLVAFSGYVTLVNVNASVTRGHFGKTYTVAKQATDAGASRGVGTFCQFLTGGTTPDALLYPVDLLGSSLTNPMTTKGDIIQADTGGTPLRLAAGTSGFVLTAAGAGNLSAWAAAAGNAGATIQTVTRTSGSLTLTGSVSTMAELSSALRLTIAAATGDVLLMGLSALIAPGGSGEMAIDSATIVSGSIVNQVSAGSKGIGHGYTSASINAAAVGTLTYVVVSGDISGGNVIVSPTYINSSSSAASLLATTTYGLTYWVLNLKH